MRAERQVAGELLVKRAGCFAAAIVLTVFLVGPAWARIGVISVTDGTTSAVQGADLQTGQRLTTGADGRAHLMFVDGSAVTVGPNSALRIDSYAYDPASKTGTMALGVEQGMIRFVGGAISKTTDVRIATPSSTIGVRGGIAAVAVGAGGATTADFLHGSAMRVENQGITQTATRAGSRISVDAGGRAGAPTVLGSGQLTGLQTLDRASGRSQPTNRAAGIDEAFAKFGFATRNPSALPQLPSTATVALSMPGQQAVQQAGQIRQAGLVQQTVTTPVGIVQSPSVVLPVAAPAVSTPPPAATPQTAAPKPSAPPPPTSRSGGATIFRSSGTIPLPGTVPPGFTSGFVGVSR